MTLNAETSANATAYYLSDGKGNVTAMFDSSGRIQASYEYDPFGNTIAISGPLANANTYRFSSKEWNDHAGLYYYGYRFYDPNLQRWPNRDPLGDVGSLAVMTAGIGPDTESKADEETSAAGFGEAWVDINRNLFGALNNNPINRFDAMGLKTCTGEARVLQGNKETIGKPGGFSTPDHPVNVTPDSAAVDPAQWGGKSNLRPNLGNISGSFTDSSGKQVGSFSGISDVIGGKSPDPKKNVRDALKERNPGKLIVELPSAPKDLGTVNVKLTVPDNMACPEGTK